MTLRSHRNLQCLIKKWLEKCDVLCVLEEEFQQLQQSFMEKYYMEFDDSDENKLSYTAIFNEYVSCWASHLGPTPLLYKT